MDIASLGDTINRTLADGDRVEIRVPFFADWQPIEELSEIPGGWLQFRCLGQQEVVYYLAIDKVEGVRLGRMPRSE